MSAIQKHFKVNISQELLSFWYRLEVSEKRIIWLILSQIKPYNAKYPDIPAEEVTSGRLYYLSAKDYAKLTETDEDNAFKLLKEAAKNLYERTIRNPNYNNTPNDKQDFRWIQSKAEINSKREIAIRFSEEIIPHISNLKGIAYREFYLEDCLKFKTHYAWKLYDFFSRRNITYNKNSPIHNPLVKEFKLPPEDIINLLQAPKAYEDYRNLKHKILIPACKHMEETGLIMFDREEGEEYFKEEKISNKVVRLTFRLTFNPPALINGRKEFLKKVVDKKPPTDETEKVF
jgi:plasmid replication initiation protein